jgi:SAM-dependent methyltransferase
LEDKDRFFAVSGQISGPPPVPAADKDVGMDWRYPLRPFAPLARLRAGVSKGVLDQILLGAPLAPGAAILDADCRSGKLLRVLRRLGFRAEGATRSAIDLDSASRRCPDADIRLLDERDWRAFPAARFRLVIARDFLPQRGSRLEPSTLSLIAELLRLVAPGGELVLIEDGDSGSSGHRRECALGLLGCFGSATRLSIVRDRSWGHLPIFGSARRETVCVRLRTPDHPVDENHWRERQRQLTAVSTQSCCDGEGTRSARAPQVRLDAPVRRAA